LVDAPASSTSTYPELGPLAFPLKVIAVNQEPTSYPEINQVLLDLHSRVAGILGDLYVGMYLYGSLATGGFDLSRSDIDFVVITTGHLQPPTIEALEAMHFALLESGNPWVKKLEGAYVPEAVIWRHNPHHPPVPTLNEGRFYLAPLGSDWILQRKMLKDSHKAISGPALDEMINAISADELKDAVREVLVHWWVPMLKNPARLEDPGYQPYAVLSMCRSLYTLSTGELVSKQAAANWAQKSLLAEWSGLIENAIDRVEEDETESIAQTIKFMEYVIELCRAL
jgi:hypothetical protein